MELTGAGGGVAMSTDGDLWSRSATGDRRAFGELFERHAHAVWNHAYRLTGSWASAEDLTSQTFLIAWRKRIVALARQVDPDAAFAAALLLWSAWHGIVSLRLHKSEWDWGMTPQQANQRLVGALTPDRS